MSLILEQWLNLKAPLNRISQYLSRQGIKYTRQQLYSYTDTTAVMLMPVFKYMELYIGEAKLIGVDETHRSCREKQRLKDNSSVEDNPKSKSKMCRTYVFSITTQKVCLYYHSLERNSDIPKHILLDNEISKIALLNLMPSIDRCSLLRQIKTVKSKDFSVMVSVGYTPEETFVN